jgi:hypothetical protein
MMPSAVLPILSEEEEEEEEVEVEECSSFNSFIYLGQFFHQKLSTQLLLRQS